MTRASDRKINWCAAFESRSSRVTTCSCCFASPNLASTNQRQDLWLPKGSNARRYTRVPDQNGISRLYNMLQLCHSGPLLCSRRSSTCLPCTPKLFVVSLYALSYSCLASLHITDNCVLLRTTRFHASTARPSSTFLEESRKRINFICQQNPKFQCETHRNIQEWYKAMTYCA